MTIEFNRSEDKKDLTVALEGRLDTTTAPQLEQEIRPALDGVTALTFDMTKLEYISSAGLRVLLTTQKAMSKQGSMVIRGANQNLMDIFEVTGFTDILTFA